MRARMWYVVPAIIPATRIVTGPPGGAGTGEVDRSYKVVVPNSTVTSAAAGTVIVKIATCGMLGAGVIEAERAGGAVSDIDVLLMERPSP